MIEIKKRDGIVIFKSARIIQRKPQVARTNAERLEARGLACRVGSSQQWRPTAAGIDAVSARITKRAA